MQAQSIECATGDQGAEDSCSSSSSGSSTDFGTGRGETVSGDTGVATVAAGNLPSESLPPAVFYSMKMVTGKDAVGTLSGPGTLGIELRGGRGGGGAPAAAGKAGKDGSADVCGTAEGGWIGSSGSGSDVCGAGGGRGIIGGSGEDRLSAVQTLVNALSWGKGVTEVEREAVAGGARKRREAKRSSAGAGSEAIEEIPSYGRKGRKGAAAAATVADRLELGDGETVTQTARAKLGAASSGGSLDLLSIGDLAGEMVDSAGGEDNKECWNGGDGGDGDHVVPDEVYLYSLEKGFLMLRPDLRQKHGIVTANVTISVHDPCLGGPVIQVRTERVQEKERDTALFFSHVTPVALAPFMCTAFFFLAFCPAKSFAVL